MVQSANQMRGESRECKQMAAETQEEKQRHGIARKRPEIRYTVGLRGPD